MPKTFYRSELEDGSILCSWYDNKGKRYRTESTTFKSDFPTAKACDDVHGFMAYAKQKRFDIVDNAELPHPSKLDLPDDIGVIPE